jgi:chromosome segregation ATPase
MLKKLLIAAAAVVVGLLIVKKSSLVQVWLKDTSSWFSAQVSPETRIKQLQLEIGKIDGDIRTAVNALVKQEVAYKELEGDVKGLQVRVDQTKQDMLGLIDALEKNSTQVSFQGQKYSNEVAQIKLEGLQAKYENDKKTLKIKEQNLKVKAGQLEVADQRIKKIQTKKEELSTLVVQLEAQLANLRLKQVDNNIPVNDSQVSKCENLARNLKNMLAEEEIKADKLARYGLMPQNNEQSTTVEKRTTKDSIKAARAALADEDKVAGEQ